MIEDFETPREAMLAAELRIANAKVAYLSQALNMYPGEAIVTPVAVVEEKIIDFTPRETTMFPLNTVQGTLDKFGRYHVIATARRQAPEDFRVSYMVPGVDLVSFKHQIGYILPDLHKRFILSLAEALKKL